MIRFIPIYKQGLTTTGNLVKHKQVMANGISEKHAKEIIKWYNFYMKEDKK